MSEQDGRRTDEVAAERMTNDHARQCAMDIARCVDELQGLLEARGRVLADFRNKERAVRKRMEERMAELKAGYFQQELPLGEGS